MMRHDRFVLLDWIPVPSISEHQRALKTTKCMAAIQTVQILCAGASRDKQKYIYWAGAMHRQGGARQGSTEDLTSINA